MFRSVYDVSLYMEGLSTLLDSGVSRSESKLSGVLTLIGQAFASPTPPNIHPGHATPNLFCIAQISRHFSEEANMSDLVKRIDSIKNMAVFQEFDWRKAPVAEGDSAAAFAKINVLYGRNYSGKTTLSRIFRAIETGRLSDKFDNPSFSVVFKDGTQITHNTLQNQVKKIRVFNEDFVRDNLRFIADPDDGIEPFAVLGEDNNAIEREIQELESEIGSNDEGNETGLYAKHRRAATTLQAAEQALDEAERHLDDQLRAKATNKSIGIKYKAQRFGDQNYNIQKMKSDIGKVRKATYKPLSDEQLHRAEQLIGEEALEPIPPFHAPVLNASKLLAEVNAIATKKINESNKIVELLKDVELNRWVKEGRALHKNERENCAFCGSNITTHRWAELEKHFDMEAEKLEKDIDAQIAKIDAEKSKAISALVVDKSTFYARFHERLDDLSEALQDSLKAYHELLDWLASKLRERRDQIFAPVSFDEPDDTSGDLTSVWDLYEEIRKESDDFSSSLSTEQTRAQDTLRLKEVFDYLITIGYEEQVGTIRDLTNSRGEALSEMQRIQNFLDQKLAEVASKKHELNDEEKGAVQVNEYLNNFFGHHFLSLEARECEAEGADSKQIRFEVIRDGKKAYHLSEGERSLLAFCYFLAKLQDVDTKDSKPIIWIDDPVSSLDANHIFFVFSLIDAEITTTENFEQLFVSTHNLNFLKYLKRLGGEYLAAFGRRKDYPRAYFQLVRHSRTSTIARMPRYLREYVTEFNYLFHQIHRCAEIEAIDDDNYTAYYHFANDARKFLEIYLYYKYPDKGMTLETLGLFFGEESIPAILTDRINNEYSHLSGVFERGSTPIEEPEMRTAAKQIIERLKEDKDQFSALLSSVGLGEESS